MVSFHDSFLLHGSTTVRRLRHFSIRTQVTRSSRRSLIDRRDMNRNSGVPSWLSRRKSSGVKPRLMSAWSERHT